MRQARLYLRTFVAFSVHPYRFAREWSVGAEAMNPLTFMATSAALLGLANKVFTAWVKDQPSGLWHDLTDSVGPYLYYAAIALVCHAGLRMFGGRGLWQGSLAIGLFAGGTLASAVRLFGRSVVFYLRWRQGLLETAGYDTNNAPLALLFLSSLLWFFVALALGLAGLHGLRRRLSLALVLVLLLATSFIPSRIDIPVPHLHFARSHTGSSLGFSLGVSL